MKVIHSILSTAVAGLLASSLLTAAADAACVGGTCTSGGAGTSRGAPAGGSGVRPSGGGGGHGGGGGGGGPNWGGVAAGTAAGIITGIITQQMMQQGQGPTEEPARSRRVRRSGNGNGVSSGNDVGGGTKPAVDDTSLQYAQVPSDTNDMGIVSDAGSIGPARQTTGSVGPAQATTGSVGSSGSTTEPLPYEPPEPPQDYLSTTGRVVKWVFKWGAQALVSAVGGEGVVAVYEIGENGKDVKDGAKGALQKNQAEKELHDERVAPAVESMERNAAQGRKPFGSDLNDPSLFGP